MNDVIVEAKGLVKSFRPLRSWRNLHKAPPAKVALGGVNLVVKRGEIFGLLGPNGAGKTTLLRILVGLILPDAGTAEVNGHDVVEEGRAVRGTIGVIYGDERSFFWRLSVRENLRFYASLFGLSGSTAERRIDSLIDLVGLANVADRPMHSYSSGMRQRASIARGLVNDPSLIFMDEPTRSLDPEGALELRHLIADTVSSEGRTVVIATNLMHEAEALCDRLMLIDQGREVITGTMTDFRQKVGSEVTYEFLIEGRGQFSIESFEALPGVRRANVDRSTDAAVITLVMDSEASALPEVIRHILDLSLEILSCSRREPSLDRVFSEIVRRSRHEFTDVPS